MKKNTKKKNITDGEAPEEIKEAPEKTSGKKKNGRKKKWPIVVVSILLVIALLGAFVVTNYRTVLGWFGINKDFSDTELLNEKYAMLNIKETLYDQIDPNLLVGDTDTINILLFGLDEDSLREDSYDVFRPDTIMVISVNFKEGSIKILSVPRDSYVPIYTRGGSKDRVNTSFMFGSYLPYSSSEEMTMNGIKVLKGTVSELLGGININYYIGVNMDTAAKIIDEIGGVYYNLTHDVYYHTDLVFEARDGMWNGPDFILLARQRSYPNGDIDRTSMQQELLKALFNQVKKIKISKIPGVVKLAYESMLTDIDLKTAVSFALGVLDIDTSSIKTATVPGYFGTFNFNSVWIINQNGRVNLIEDFYGFTPTWQAQDELWIVTKDLWEYDESVQSWYYVNQDTEEIVYITEDGKEREKDGNGNYIFDVPSGGGESEGGEEGSGEGGEE